MITLLVETPMTDMTRKVTRATIVDHRVIALDPIHRDRVTTVDDVQGRIRGRTRARRLGHPRIRLVPATKKVTFLPPFA